MTGVSRDLKLTFAETLLQPGCQARLERVALISINRFVEECHIAPSAKMTHLDLFLQKGPVNGDLVAGLEELRRTVLLDGIPSNSDGMVRHVQTPIFWPPADSIAV